MAPTKKNGETPIAAPEDATATLADESPKTSSAQTSAPANDSVSSPSSYEMPDDYASDTLTSVKKWIEDNPTLAIAAAAGLGFVASRLITAIFPDPEPPLLAERVEERARKLRKEASHYADDAGEALAQKLKTAADALSDAAETAAHKAEAGYERSKDIADVVAEATKAAVAGVVAKKADSWLGRWK